MDTHHRWGASEVQRLNELRNHVEYGEHAPRWARIVTFAAWTAVAVYLCYLLIRSL